MSEELPPGIVAIRISAPSGVMWLTSDRLTPNQELIAKVAATAIAIADRRIVVVLRECALVHLARLLAAA